MSIAYWCVLAAAILPYATVGLAKSQGRYDNRVPRAPDAYVGFALRANGAHLNGLEVFPFFAAAVLVASRASPHASHPLLDALAVLWLLSRLGYTAAYLADLAALRSIVWIIGLIVTILIFTIPAWSG